MAMGDFDDDEYERREQNIEIEDSGEEGYEPKKYEGEVTDTGTNDLSLKQMMENSGL